MEKTANLTAKIKNYIEKRVNYVYDKGATKKVEKRLLDLIEASANGKERFIKTKSIDLLEKANRRAYENASDRSYARAYTYELFHKLVQTSERKNIVMKPHTYSYGESIDRNLTVEEAQLAYELKMAQENA